MRVITALILTLALVASYEEVAHADGQGKVKGNISGKGNKTYHVPGCPQYQDVRINKPGERFFRTEEEARAAGWKKAGNCPNSSSTTSTSGSGCASGRCCNKAGLEDSYVLALSWQPAFCEINRRKKGCAVSDSSSWQATHFTLHGLWPNRNACGTSYGYCGSGRSFSISDESVKAGLKQVMPNYSEGGDLHLYEWRKHGTCQSRSATDYFRVAIKLTRSFNAPSIVRFMNRNAGKEVSKQEFLGVVDSALVAGASRRLTLKCKNGNLVDVYISLPKSLKGALKDMLPHAKKAPGGNCGERFRIDSIAD